MSGSYPSPTFNTISLQNPLALASGGTGASTGAAALTAIGAAALAGSASQTFSVAIPTAAAHAVPAGGMVANIAWFGGSVSSSDNSGALNAAIASLPSTGGQVFFGPGTWTFASPVSFTYPTAPGAACSLSFVGAGAANTVLVWPSTSGITLAASNPKHSFHFRDMTIRTGSAGTSVGVTLTQSAPMGNCDQSDFTRVTFDATATSNYWVQAVNVVGWSFINFSGILIYADGSSSTGVKLAGNSSSSPYYAVVFNFTSCGFFGCGYAIQYGSYVQGVTVNQCNFTNGAIGILVNGASGNLSELIVSNNQFGLTGGAIDVTTAINELMVSNNLIIPAANAVGINITGACSFNTFIGNVFPGPNTAIGILFNGAVTDSIIMGNVFQGLETGIELQTNTTRINVQSNRYSNSTNTVVNAGSGNTVGGGSS